MRRIIVSCFSLVIFQPCLGVGSCLGQLPPKSSPDGVRLCEAGDHRTYVLPAIGIDPRRVLTFSNGEQIVVEPSSATIDGGESLAARYDYEIVLQSTGTHYRITSFAQNPEDGDELAYRRLDSIGVTCISAKDVIVYLSFAVNGSRRDFFYVGMRTSLMDEPVALGRSIYGVLSLDPRNPLTFSIWDSSRATSVDGMGEKHVYRVSVYRWEAGRKSPELSNTHSSKPAYAGLVLAESERGIRIGGPVER